MRGGGEVDAAEEDGREPVVPGGEAPAVLEAADHARDDVAAL